MKKLILGWLAFIAFVSVLALIIKFHQDEQPLKPIDARIQRIKEMHANRLGLIVEYNLSFEKIAKWEYDSIYYEILIAGTRSSYKEKSYLLTSETESNFYLLDSLWIKNAKPKDL